MKIPYDCIIEAANVRKDALMAIEAFVNDGDLERALQLIGEAKDISDHLDASLKALDAEGIKLLGDHRRYALQVLANMLRYPLETVTTHRQNGSTAPAGTLLHEMREQP